MQRVGGLFSGIGALELGFHRAGFQIEWLCEREPVRQAILWERFGRPIYHDVAHVNATCAPQVDVLVGGVPCTNISNAGDKAGIEGEQSRLWYEMLRVVRELRPSWVLMENVAALTLSGRGLDVVLGGLAESGYDAEWDCLPAAAFGAPQRRDRIWLVAYPHDPRRGEQRRAEPASEELLAAQRARAAPWVAPDAAGRMRERDGGPGLRPRRSRGLGWGRLGHGARPDGADESAPARSGIAAAIPPWRSPLPAFGAGSDHGPPPEPLLRGVVHGLPSRVDRVDALGDSAVPQAPEWVAWRIRESEGW